jgi:hypothetical protein
VRELGFCTLKLAARIRRIFNNKPIAGQLSWQPNFKIENLQYLQNIKAIEAHCQSHTCLKASRFNRDKGNRKAPAAAATPYSTTITLPRSETVGFSSLASSWTKSA